MKFLPAWKLYSFLMVEGRSSRLCASKSTQEQRVQLGDGRREALLDFVARMPSIWGKAFTPELMRQAWLDTGIVSQDGSGPDIEKMYGTRSQWNAEERELCDKSFPEMVRDMIYTGQVAESQYDQWGFPKDTNWNGVVKERDSNPITNGGQQRAEWCSHEAKRAARNEHHRACEQDQMKKHTLLVDNVQSLLTYSKTCSEKLWNAVIEEQKCFHLQEGQSVEIWARKSDLVTTNRLFARGFRNAT